MLSPVRAREAVLLKISAVTKASQKRFWMFSRLRPGHTLYEHLCQSVWLVTWGIVYIKASAYLSYKD